MSNWPNHRLQATHKSASPSLFFWPWVLRFCARLSRSVRPQMIRLAIFLSLAFFAAHAYASCDDPLGTRDSTLSKCLLPALVSAESKMNRELQSLLSVIKSSPTNKDLDTVNIVLRSQDNWLRYRDQYCEAEGLALVGGISSRAIPETECKIALTRQRTAAFIKLRKKLLP